MRKLFIPLLLCFIYADLSAQSVPGYLGYRKSISYEVHFHPSFSNQTTEKEQVNSFGISYQHHLRLDWVVNKKITLGVDAALFNTYVNPFGNYASTIYYHNTRYDTAFGYNNAKINVKSLAFVIRLQKQHFAPLGKYVELKAGFIHYKAEEYPFLMIESSQKDTLNESVGSFQNNSILPYAGLGFGYNRVVKDRLLISFSFDINYVFRGASYMDGAFIPNDYDIWHEDDIQISYKNLVEGRIFASYLTNIRVGVGYLF